MDLTGLAKLAFEPQEGDEEIFVASNSIYDAIRSNITDEGERLKVYIDAKLGNVGADRINDFISSYKGENKEALPSRASHIETVKVEKPKPTVASKPIIEVNKSQKDVLSRLQDAVADMGYECKVSKHRAGANIWNVKVAFDDICSVNQDLITQVFEKEGYKYQSKYRNALYFKEK